MKIFSKTFFILWSIFLVSLLIVLPFENSISKAMSNKGNEGRPSFLRLKSDQSGIEPIVFDDFDLIEGLEIADLDRRRIIQLGEGSKKGRAAKYFYEQSARYDVTLYYIDESNGKSVVKVSINDQSIGSILFDTYNAKNGASSYFSSYKEKTIHGIDIQQWSKITLEFIGDGEEKCRIEKLVFTPTGVFDGKAAKLTKPKTLRIYETQKEQLIGHQVFSNFVETRIDSLAEKRKSELAGLKNPAEWREKQKKTREQLSKYLGEFPARTPLNAKIIKKTDREHYTIENLIFESQPGYYVAANLYVPKGRKLPLPGVVFTCGHYNDAKVYDEYHLTCLGLVNKGYIVLIFDPMGQGERSEYFDPLTLKTTFSDNGYYGVEQHNYLGRPSFLVDWTLAGLRTWDAVRAVDYLVSRPETDKNRLASVGQSGGGQMALLLTAVDERIKVCAASHPGGSCESVFLSGQSLAEKEIFSLIPPRPLRIIVGKESGEEPGLRRKLEDIQLFYEGLGAGRQCGDMDVVPGYHTMNRSNRESAYEWLNKWLDKEAEGKAEAVLEPEKTETLRCTEKGNTIGTLGGETGQSLNAKRADRIYKPETDLTRLKERTAARIGLKSLPNSHQPKIQSLGTFIREDLSIEKLTYESEKGIIVPALLIKPKNVKTGSPVYIFASDKGKPSRIEHSMLPFQLAKNGSMVLAIDVRGIGETSPSSSLVPDKLTGYNPLLYKQDVLAVECGAFGQTTLGMRTFDLMRGIDFINSRKETKGRKIIVTGEGLGGLWALLASIYDSRTDGVVTVGTLPSYKLLITNQYYNVWGYFWVPGALRDFDIPDLARLVSPKPQIWIDPVNALGRKLNLSEASPIIGSNKNLHIVTFDNDSIAEVLQQFNKLFN